MKTSDLFKQELLKKHGQAEANAFEKTYKYRRDFNVYPMVTLQLIQADLKEFLNIKLQEEQKAKYRGLVTYLRELNGWIYCNFY